MQEWLEAISPVAIYVVVTLGIALQFLCLPSPGSVILTTALLLAARGQVDPLLVCCGAVAGATLGSAAGYTAGQRGGQPLLDKLNRRFPRIFSSRNITRTRASIDRWGLWVVLVSCFSAALRMLTPPLAGVLGLPFWRFLATMSASAALWTSSTAAAIHVLGTAAEAWLNKISVISLVLLAAFGLVSLVAWSRRPRTSWRGGEGTTPPT